MKKRIVLNCIMALLIALMALACVLFVGHMKGWFDRGGEGVASVQTQGIVRLTRGGVELSAAEAGSLRAGDILSTDSGARATVQCADTTLTLGGYTAVVLDDMRAPLTLRLTAGEIFLRAGGGAAVTIGTQTVHASDCVVYADTQGVAVYAGTATVGAEEIRAGECLAFGGTPQPAAIDALSDFQLAQLRALGTGEALCFSPDALQALHGARTQGATEPTQPMTEPTQPATEPTQPTTEPTQPATEPTQPTTEPTQPATEPARKCTVAIRCDEILSHFAQLDPAKAEFVPQDGYILRPTAVTLRSGESAFDVLRRVCAESGIALEYSFTPVYNSYYVEGINNLYEFDCGSQSGWLYQVNGVYPNYGSSAYPVSDGDAIVWRYTCDGLSTAS